MSADTNGDESAVDLREKVRQLEARTEELEEQLEEQQETTRKMMPNRRDLLKAGGAGAAALVFGSAATGNAAAGSASTGTVGSSSYPLDYYAEDIYDHNGNNPMSFPGDGSVNIEQLSIGGYQRDNLLFDDSDSDTGTALSFDTGTIESCHTVGVKFTVYGHGAGNSSSIDVTVNNNTTTDYQWSEIDGSTLSNPSGESAWQFGQFDQSGHTWTFDLSASGGGAAGTDIPTLTGPVGAVAHGQLVGGTLPTVDVETINSVQVSTNFNATGDIRVYGGETA